MELTKGTVDSLTLGQLFSVMWSDLYFGTVALASGLRIPLWSMSCAPSPLSVTTHSCLDCCFVLNWFPRIHSCSSTIILTAARVIFQSYPIPSLVQWFSISLKISFNLLALLQGLTTYGLLTKSGMHLLLYGLWVKYCMKIWFHFYFINTYIEVSQFSLLAHKT